MGPHEDTPETVSRAPGARRRRNARRLGMALLLLLLLAGLGWAALSSAQPCWSTYRAPDLVRDVCLSVNGAAGFAPEAAADALATLTRGWQQGDRREFVAVEGARAAASIGEPERACEWLERSLQVESLPDRAYLEGPAFSRLHDAPCFEAFLVTHQRAREALAGELTRSTPEAAGFDPAALSRLLERAHATHTSGLVLLHNGAIVHESYAEGGDVRTELMSATKAIAGLSIGLLVDAGKIRSVDAPLSDFFPEWGEGQKSAATLRHVLSHTSGLAAQRNVMDFILRKDFVRHAIEEELESPPGSRLFYNNKATNLIPGVVEQVTGQPMDVYLATHLFAPLGIRDWDWLHDPSGNPHGMSGLRMHPLELAKVGVMLAQGGRWGEQRVLSEAWIQAAFQQGSPNSGTFGYLFVIHPHRNHRTLDQAGVERLRAAGVKAEVLEALQPLLDRPVEDRDFATVLIEAGGPELFLDLRDRELLPPLEVSEEVVGASAVGSGGIHLTVFPSEGLVAVRTTRTDGSGDMAYAFPDFPNRVRALLPALSVDPVEAPVP